MKLFDRITSYVAIICALILCFMLVSSAGSWTAWDEDEGNIYSPYISFDYMTITAGSGDKFVLDVDNVFGALSYNSSNGTDTELLLDFENSNGNLSIPVVVRVTPATSGTNLIYQLSFGTAQFDYDGGVHFDGMEIDLHCSDQIISSSYTSGDWMPSIQLYSYDSEYSFNMEYSASVNYCGLRGNDIAFYSDSNFTRSWTGLTGKSGIFRSSNIIETAQGRETASSAYASSATGASSLYLVEDYNVHITANNDIERFILSIPYSTTHHTYKQYVNNFDLGTAVIRTSVVTSIVPSPSAPGDWIDFSNFLVVAVKGFMDFGFWGISIAGILGFIIAFKLVKVILNFFAGG